MEASITITDGDTHDIYGSLWMYNEPSVDLPSLFDEYEDEDEDDETELISYLLELMEKEARLKEALLAANQSLRARLDNLDNGIEVDDECDEYGVRTKTNIGSFRQTLQRYRELQLRRHS